MGGLFSPPKPPPAPVAPAAPAVADKDIQDAARSDRARRAQAMGRGSTILTSSATEVADPNNLKRSTLLGG